jgi:hypothetical protein
MQLQLVVVYAACGGLTLTAARKQPLPWQAYRAPDSTALPALLSKLLVSSCSRSVCRVTATASLLHLTTSHFDCSRTHSVQSHGVGGFQATGL